MKPCYIFFLCCLLTGVTQSKKSHEAALRTQLLKEYDKHALPAPHTTVTVRFTVLHYEMNERTQTLDVNLWVAMEWNDPRLKWSPANFPNIDRIAIESSLVWTPDLKHYSSGENQVEAFKRTTQVIVSPINGSIMWVPPTNVKAACIMDLTYWPYDIHNCSLKFGSWVHSGETVDLAVVDEAMEFDHPEKTHGDLTLTRSEWEILDSTVYRESKVYDCCPEEYVSVHGLVILKRIGDSHWWTIQMPIIVLAFMTVAVYLLPPTAGEKVIFAAISFALSLFTLFTVSDEIGHSSNHTPLLVSLLSKQVLYSGINVIISSILLRMARDPHSTHLPFGSKSFVCSLARVLGLNGYREIAEHASISHAPIMKSDDLELGDQTNLDDQRAVIYQPNSRIKHAPGESDWLLTAAVLDRICFIIFLVIFIINMISYRSVL